MKNFKILSAILLTATFLGCGGGGGSSQGNTTQLTDPVVPVVTVSVFGPLINIPKYLVFSGQNLYVTYQAGVISLNAAGTQTNTYAVTNAVGIAVQGGHVYHTGEVGGQDTVLELGGNGSGLVPYAANNFDGMVFYSSNMLFIANTSSVLAYTNFLNPQTISTFGAIPIAMAADTNRSRVYATLDSNQIAEINPTNSNAIRVLTQSSPAKWGPLSRPNGVAVASNGFAYVVNQGDASGNAGYISKINTTTGDTEVLISDTVGAWGATPVGFCNPTGIALDSNEAYLYVTNRSCSANYSGYGNLNRILKIKLP